MIEVTTYYPTARYTDEIEADKVRIEFVKPKRPFLWWGTCREAEEIQFPKGYGVVYYDFPMHRLLFAPLPFNVIISWLIRLWCWVRVGCASSQYMSSIENKIRKTVRGVLPQPAILKRASNCGKDAKQHLPPPDISAPITTSKMA